MWKLGVVVVASVLASACEASGTQAYGQLDASSSVIDLPGTAESRQDAGSQPSDAGNVADAAGSVDAGTDVVIGFDGLPDGLLPARYADVVWDSDWYAFHAIQGNYEAHSGMGFITNDKAQGSLSFSFAQPVFFKGAWFSLDPTRSAHVRVDVYDAQGGLIGSSATLLQQLTPRFLAANFSNVKKVSVVFDVDFAMDDVTFAP